MQPNTHPGQLIIIRHGESETNRRIQELSEDLEFKRFKYKYYKANPHSRKSIRLAKKLSKRFGCKLIDHSIPLTELGTKQAIETGQKLKDIIEIPHIILTSPYTRTLQTLEGIKKGWPELKQVHSWNVILENALREQEMGQLYLYTSFDLFFALNENESKLYNADKYSPYFYRFPSGESIADLTMRVDNWYNKILRQYAGKRILIISHNRTIYAIRALLENWDFRCFMEKHDTHKMHNCGITTYNRASWSDKMELAQFNLKLWKD